MNIKIRGARENNLQNIDVDISDGLTVVTGISGSGKTSLVFDTLYHEARRRFLDIFSTRNSSLRLLPAKVQSLTGAGPTIAVGQNLLNRNPLSTLATASGLHPFLRLLYANLGERRCSKCGAKNTVLKEDEIIDRILLINKTNKISIFAPLVQNTIGSHRTFLSMLKKAFDPKDIIIDGESWEEQKLDSSKKHNIDLLIGVYDKKTSIKEFRKVLEDITALGSYALKVKFNDYDLTFSKTTVCIVCNTWLGEIEPLHFHTSCPYCKGKGCEKCKETGLHPKAVPVYWKNLNLTELLAKTVSEVKQLFDEPDLPSTANRLVQEILKRINSLERVGLGYISLNRSSPTLSRGESQRVRLAVAISSRLEDMLYVLDEPTIGQHIADVKNFLPILRKLKGPVIFVEHDRMAAVQADYAIDIGPAAGNKGGEIVYSGKINELWRSDTYTGRYFSLRDRVKIPTLRDQPDEFLIFKGVSFRTLKDIDVTIPINCLSVITGVSGSGKSTFVEEVLVTSLSKKKPVGCKEIIGPMLKTVIVDQSPIGRNPRSNPATYTKLSDIIREIFAAETGLSASHFSFNRPEGACQECKGIGALEVKMRYLPSTWITCSSCSGERFSDEVLAAKANFNGETYSIADFYRLDVSQAFDILEKEMKLTEKNRKAACRILKAMHDVGLGYLPLGQPSTTISGGEAQRVKLAKYLGRASLSGRLIILDEPSTGLHPYDITGLLNVLDYLVRSGGTIVVVEHNSDIIKAADWIIDLGPGAGEKGGNLVFTGSVNDLLDSKKSITGQLLKEEEVIHPDRVEKKSDYKLQNVISIRGANIHNLQNVDVDFQKNKLTVVTGVSGSGKSSLVSDILETEARRRFLETLTLYERQSTREGPEAPVDTVIGLGVTISVKPDSGRYNLRNTVGIETEISYHLAVLFANIGKKECEKCKVEMLKGDHWICPSCKSKEPVAKVRHFSPVNYAAACNKCNGVGSLRKPCPEKLIIKPEKPICSGGMYSPGFFPCGYICKEFNGGYYIIQSLAKRYNFDPKTTPWNEMPSEAQQAFLFGDSEPLEVHSIGRKGHRRTFKMRFRGLYGWMGEWDVGGTYTETEICPDCKGGRLKPQYLNVRINGFNIHDFKEMPLKKLASTLVKVKIPTAIPKMIKANLDTILKRLDFLKQVGLGYIHLNRIYATLSAGEAQRVKLAGLLVSGLTSLTILLDEPSRGLHPSEVNSLIEALQELCQEGNTVIIVEHDPIIIRNADYLLDMGPGPGITGGKIVAQGTLRDVLEKSTLTTQWLQGDKKFNYRKIRRKPLNWMKILGAVAYNLKGEEVRIPLGVLTGLCGVSGSGKSTLLIDTLGRKLVPRKQTTSVAYEPIEPGEHKEIVDAPERMIILDQSRRGIYNPLHYLGLTKPITKLYAESEDAQVLGIKESQLTKRCSVCLGRGRIYTNMGFLPSIRTPCDTCKGSGHIAEVWDIRLKGYTLPELYQLTINQVYELFKDEEKIARKLKIAIDVGLGYLVLRQPGYSLSGGEAQRLKIALELSKKTKPQTMYILDEPTVGQHLDDISRFAKILHKLVDDGHSIIVIEHSPELLASCDWLIELGPGGGPEGGKVVASGTPEQIANGKTPTAPFIKEILEFYK